MKKIIIATDFTENSRHTIRHVLDHVRDVDSPCEIILLNTYMVQENDPKKVIKTNDRLKVISKAGLEAEKQETLKLINNPNITVSTASHMGSLKNVILQLMSKDTIDVVAMGKDEGKNIEAVSKLLKDKNCLLLVSEFPETRNVAAI